MKRFIEVAFYVSFAAGMAFGTSSFTMISGLFEITTATWVIAAIVLSGLGCVLISLSVAELASMFPSAPGVRTYLKVAFGDRPSLILVYLYLIFMVLVAGVESYMFSLVTRAIFPSAPAFAVILVLVLATMAINMLGLEVPRGAQIVTTFALILGVFALGVLGWWHQPEPSIARVNFRIDNWVAGVGRLPTAIVMAIFLFTGFEWVTLLGFSPKSYQRAIPWSMPVGILVNVIAYCGFVVGCSCWLSSARIVEAPTPQIPYFNLVLGPTGVYFAGVISLLAIFSTFNAGIMGGSRLIYVLTREGTLPIWCAKTSLRTGAPTGGILILGTCTLVASALILRYHGELLAAVIGATIVSFLYAGFLLAVLRLRRTQPATRRSYRTPVPVPVQWLGAGLLPILGVASLFSQATMASKPVIGLGIAVLAAVVAAQLSLSRNRAGRTSNSASPRPA